MNEMQIRFREALLTSGKEIRAWEWLGAHREGEAFAFRVWAPNADAVYLVGEFNSWEKSCPMTRLGDIWEATLPCEKVREGVPYKYLIVNGDRELYRSDPYAYKMDAPPYCNSIVTDIEEYVWRDKGWMAQRDEQALAGFYSQPINIYEIHAGSWMRRGGRCLSYVELAEELAPYVKQMGYTHVELLPIAEHPYYGSWGYQSCGYFAPTARYGTPEDFMRFVDIMHCAGVGVILDFTPAHFPKDSFGLYEFDGSHLYESEDEKKREHRSWGTVRFDLEKKAVASFISSNVFYWIEKYHVDGLRADAVSSMIYLDYDKADGDWTPNKFGDNRCLEAIEFWRELNRAVKAQHPSLMMIAEESSAWQGVTSFEGDGLGFDLKWNMGWMNDTLSYAATDFKYRRDCHGKLNFPLVYAFNEKYILPISHDEVVYGKRSFLDKMPGAYLQKFAGARLFEALKMTSPGKKLSFMGSEIGQFREWDHESEIEWFLLDYEAHRLHQLYISDLNNFYLSHPELWQRDGGWDGFCWIDADDKDRNVISYRRVAENGYELVVVLNFSAKAYGDYFLPVPFEGAYEEIFNSDDRRYGGGGCLNGGELLTCPNPQPLSGKAAEKILPYALKITLPPLSASILRLKRKRFED